MDFGFYIDVKRCSGCYACTVACMDQNDIDVSSNPIMWRQVFKVEMGDSSYQRISYISLSCMHCQDAPCMMACPTGAISKDNFVGAIIANSSLCIGCHSCALACPFGIPKFGLDGSMQKCTNCIERLENHLEPACVRVCPTKALKYGPLNEIENNLERKVAEKLVSSLTNFHVSR